MERQKENQRRSFKASPTSSRRLHGFSPLSLLWPQGHGRSRFVHPRASAERLCAGSLGAPGNQGFCGFGDPPVSGLSSCYGVQSGLRNYFFTAAGCTEQRCFKAKERHLSQLRRGVARLSPASGWGNVTCIMAVPCQSAGAAAFL